MSYGASSRNAIQFGVESTAGTAVAATDKWFGTFNNWENAVQRENIESQVGLLVNPTRTFTGWEGASLSIPSTAATFEQTPHVMEASVGTATPTGAGPYVYDYVTGITSAPAFKTYTIEAGNFDVPNDNRRAAYAFCNSWTLSGTTKQPWNIESSWTGQQMESSTLTPALTLPSVEEMAFNKTQLFIDASGGTIGGTEITTAVLMGAQIQCSNSGIREVPAATGNNYYTSTKRVAPEMTFTLTLEVESFTDVVATERAAYEANSFRLFQLLVTGTGGREMRLRWCGQYTDFPSYTDSDGNTNITIAGNVTYNTTDSIFFENRITNTLASL